MSFKDGNSAIFIMPRKSSAWFGSEALWITVAGWAKAAERKLGKAWVVTTDRVASPDEVASFPIRTSGQSQGTGLSRYLPEVLVTALKDFRLYQSSKSFNDKELSGPWQNDSVKFVWEQHDLFNGQGRRMADTLGVPLITYVHAPTVWEAAKWGIRRPGWSSWLEKIETHSINQSDLVACVSEQVKNKLLEMGVEPKKILISPMSVDAQRFSADPMARKALRKSLGLDMKKVLGWTGSFRGFHGLDTLLHAFKLSLQAHPDLALLFVGDGKEREGIAGLAEKLGLDNAVIFVGKQPFEKIPMYVSTFDLALVSAANSATFHYSPLKLREYLAAGVATIAPDAGEVPVIFRENEHLVLYQPESVNSLSEKIDLLLDDPALAHKISVQGKEYILGNGTWSVELEKSLRYLDSISNTF